MNEALSADDRRHVRTSLTASFAFVVTFLLGGVAWAGANAPAASPVDSRATAAAAPATSGAWAASDESPNTMVGCGCAEACLAAE